MIVSGRGGQVDVSMRDVMLSQLNYRAAAWLNDGRRAAPAARRRALLLRPGPAVPDRRAAVPGPVHHPRPVLAGVRRRGRHHGVRDDGASGRPAASEVLAVVAKALATDTANNWQARLAPLGVPVGVVRSLPEALADADRLLCTAGGLRLVGNAVRVAGYQPRYGAAPGLGEHGDLAADDSDLKDSYLKDSDGRPTVG